MPRHSQRSICFALGLYLLLSTNRVHAHDLWLLPPEKCKLHVKAQVAAVSGTKFPLGDHAPNPARFAKRLVVAPDGKSAVASADGTNDELKTGLLGWTPSQPGIHIMSVQTTPKLIQLDAEAFNHYLVSDGLPHIYLLRWKEKTLDKPAVERYSKSPKVLVQVGQSQAGNPTSPLGLPLEIVPLSNPFLLKVGETLKVRVLFDKKPLAGAHLGWDHPGPGELPRGEVRTDAKGEAYVPISQLGLMTIRLTHMTRPRNAEYEWESFWTTLTFRLTAETR